MFQINTLHTLNLYSVMSIISLNKNKVQHHKNKTRHTYEWSCRLTGGSAPSLLIISSFWLLQSQTLGAVVVLCCNVKDQKKAGSRHSLGVHEEGGCGWGLAQLLLQWGALWKTCTQDWAHWGQRCTRFPHVDLISGLILPWLPDPQIAAEALLSLCLFVLI